MARRKRKQPSTPKTEPADTQVQRGKSAGFSGSRRKWILAGIGSVGAIGGASALHAWDVRTRETHDLAVIGQGTPVIVQVHDRSCAVCRRMKGVMGAVMSDRTDIIFRIADIAKPEGLELQTRYNVPKTTLLFFDEKGEHRFTQTGLQSTEEVEALIDQVMSQMQTAPS